MGAEADLAAYVISRYFPKAALGRAMGAVWIFWAWGNGVGVLIGSLSFDLTGSYGFAIWTFAALSTASAALILRLGPYTYKDEHKNLKESLA